MGPGGAGHQGEKLPAKPTDRDAMTRAHVTQPGRKKDVSLSPFFFFFPRRLAKMLIAAITIRFIGLCYEIKKSGINLSGGNGGGVDLRQRSGVNEKETM